MLKKLSAILLISFSYFSVNAAEQTYNVDSTHTFAKFSYKHIGYSTQLSKFDKTFGTISFDPIAKTGNVDITIDMKSVNTGFSVFNQHIQGEEFFNTEKFPVATFKSTKLIFNTDKLIAIDGNLTIKGITKPVTLKINNFLSNQHPMMKKPAIGADASVSIKRSDFNAGKYIPDVSDDVKIDISLEAISN